MDNTKIPNTENKDLKAILEQLHEYFLVGKSPEVIALIIRRFQNEAMKMYLDVDKVKHSQRLDKDWIAHGNFILTEICEILNPYFNKDL